MSLEIAACTRKTACQFNCEVGEAERVLEPYVPIVGGKFSKSDSVIRKLKGLTGQKGRGRAQAAMSGRSVVRTQSNSFLTTHRLRAQL